MADQMEKRFGSKWLWACIFIIALVVFMFIWIWRLCCAPQPNGGSAAKALRLLAQEQTAKVSNSSSLSPQIHAVTVRGITAHFGGENPASVLQVPLEYGVQVLWFTFEGDDAVYVFKPAGELFFSDWRFDIFSPDGAHILLLQDRYGPYHVVATDRLKDYLTGRAKPDHAVAKRTSPGEPAWVHSGGYWVSPREIRFSVACCGTSDWVTYRLP